MQHHKDMMRKKCTRGVAPLMTSVLGILVALTGVFVQGFAGQVITGSQLAATEEATDSCVASSPDIILGGTPKPVGKYCLVIVTENGDKLNCRPDDTEPAGTCKVHYCDPLGSCHDTTTSLPSDINSILNGQSSGTYGGQELGGTTETGQRLQYGEVNGSGQLSNSFGNTNTFQTSNTLQGGASGNQLQGFEDWTTGTQSSQGFQGGSGAQMQQLNSSLYTDVSTGQETSAVPTPGAESPPPQAQSLELNSGSTFNTGGTGGNERTLSELFGTPPQPPPNAFTETASNVLSSIQSGATNLVNDIRSFFGFGPVNQTPSPEFFPPTIGIRG